VTVPFISFFLHSNIQTFHLKLYYVNISRGYGLGLVVLNATFNNISAISWRSVLLVEQTGIPGKNHRTSASHWQTLSHNVVSTI